MNIYDISRKAGVSIATVSRVLNNSEHVSEETRKRVMSIIESSGYVPNAFARGLGLNTMRTVGLLCPDASDPYQAMALSYLENSFQTKGYDCLLSCTGNDLTFRKAAVENLKNRHVDGIVLMGSSFVGKNERENNYIMETARQIPVVLLNGSYQAPGVYCVLCDDQRSTYAATEHLIRTGKKKIMYLCHSMNYSGRKKLEGYRNALRDNQILFDEHLVCLVDKDDRSVERVRSLLKTIYNEGNIFNAVLCSEDILAVGAAKYAIDLGIDIPQKLSIIGYNNTVLCSCCEPELSSVDNKLEAICEQISETMIGVLEGRIMPQKMVFNGEVVTRSSTINF